MHDVYQVEEACQFTYNLLAIRIKEPESNISHLEMPTVNEHMRFFNSRPFRRWWLVKADNAWVGTAYVSTRNELSVVLLPQYRRRGYGRETIQWIIDHVPPLPESPAVRTGEFLANINPANAASIALFEGLGFKHVQNTYQLVRTAT